jgi:hypothetical protein
VDHKLHRSRRAALNPFFSKQTVARLQPMLHYLIEKLCGRIEESRKSGQPMPMREAYMCLTTDVITLYALNHSWNLLDSPDFSPFWFKTIQATEAAGHFLKHFPIMLSIFKALPYKIVAAIDPGMFLLLNWQRVSSGQLQLPDGKILRES